LRFAEKVTVVIIVLAVIGVAVLGVTALFTSRSHHSGGPPPAPLTANRR
jgi:hypothetical protein